MHNFLILLLVTCLCHIISTQSDDVRLPPHITRSPPLKNTLYERGKTLTLECSAEGTPAVRYEWKQNGFQLNTRQPNNIGKGPDGTIRIDRATETDEGYYQCYATNQYGTALSNMIHVRMAFLKSATGSPTVSRKTVVQGRPFHIQADRERSFPQPSYEWYSAYDVDAIHTLLWTTARIQFAENGDLHFAYARPEDAPGERVYSCTIYNEYLKTETRGCYTQLTMIRNSTGVSRFPPIVAFASETLTVALIGETAKLRCFFYGSPEPEISWIGPSSTLSDGRYSMDIRRTELTIDNVTASDEGDYSCTGSNTQGRNTHTIQLRVEAGPEFKKARDGPYNMNVTEGESASFSCNAIAIPEAKIVWLQNGQPIDADNPPERFVFSNDLKSLTIRDVCRDCVDRERPTDLMVIQCNASNAHGYAFAQGYLNVLMKTRVTIRGPEDASVDFLEEKQFVFLCDVISDPSRPAIVRWYKTEPYGDLVRDEPPYVYVENRFLIIMVYPNCSSDCAKYLGEYRCIGDNGYSRENQTITISYEFKPPPAAGTQNEETWAMWKIFLGTGAFGLVLFLIGLFLGLRSKRRLGSSNTELMIRKISNPPGLNERFESESLDLPRETVGKTGESIRRACSMYEHVGYDSIDQVMKDIAQRDGAVDVDGYNKYESIDAPDKEAIRTGKRMLYEDTTHDDMRLSAYLEEIQNGEEADQHQVHRYDSMRRESENMTKSRDQSEKMHSYLELNQQEVNPNVYLEKSELNSKEANSYLALVADEVNPYSGSGSNEANLSSLGYLDMDQRPRDPNSDLGLKENHNSGMGSREVNLYLEIGSKG